MPEDAKPQDQEQTPEQTQDAASQIDEALTSSEPAEASDEAALALRKEMEDLRSEVTSPEYLQFKAQQGQKPTETGAMPNFEDMSQGDVVKYILGAVQKMNSQTSENLARQIQNVGLETKKSTILADVRDAKTRFPDFSRYEKGAIEYFQKYPKLGASDCYKLAKFDAVLKQTAQKGTRPASPEEKPTQNVSNEGLEREAQSAEEAAEMAWEKVLGAGVGFLPDETD